MMTSSALQANDLPETAGAHNDLADLASESITVFDLAGMIRYWNPASERLYGWPAIGAVGRSVADMSTNAAFHSKRWHLLLQEGTWEGVVQRRTSWGGHVSATVRQIVRCDTTGEPRDVVEYGQPTAKETDAASALDSELRRLAAASWELDTSAVRPLLDAMGNSTELADATAQLAWVDELLAGTRIVDVNERAAHLVGAYAGRGRMIGQPVSAFWPHESRAVLAELIAAVATDRLRGATHMRRIASDGILRDPVVIAWRSEAAERPDTVFVAVNGAADDDRSFWYLRASEERYRRLIHFLPTALLQIDASRMDEVFDEMRAKGVDDIVPYLEHHPELVDYARQVVHVTEANPAALALFGATAAADFVRPIDFLFAASPETAQRVMVAHFEGRRNYAEIMKLRTFDGRILDVQLTVTFPSRPERLDVTLLGLEDITERLHTERQLRQLETDFAHAARISMLGELATSIAHEVNQPLSAIVTNGETSLRWLSRDEPNLPKVGQLTQRIVASARHASDIVQRIRGMTVKHTPEHVLLDLNEVVDEALLFIRHDIDANSLDLSVKLAADLPRPMGDRIQLQQVIVNLIVNSIQAIAQTGSARRRIDVATSAGRDGAVTFSICDSGPGIAAQDLDRVFDCFFSTKPDGMGVGLAVCQSIIVAHGGSISVSSPPEAGAQFRFSLPVGA